MCRGDVGCGRGLGSRCCLGGLFSYPLVDDFGGTYFQFPSITRRLQRHRHKSREGCTHTATMARTRRALSRPAETLHGARRDEKREPRVTGADRSDRGARSHSTRIARTALSSRCTHGTAQPGTRHGCQAGARHWQGTSRLGVPVAWGNPARDSRSSAAGRASHARQYGTSLTMMSHAACAAHAGAMYKHDRTGEESGATDEARSSE